ncbi:hypothetical protein ACH5RR_035787 [Cinchona calisaya]|uniref:Uncharacterized protein n=1 Tax=Cinchona calisaya TaxID=153742 RepID=A0ABD2Y2F9_9GENT
MHQFVLLENGKILVVYISVLNSRAFYVGVSSLEELLPIWTILCQTYTVPNNGGKVGGYAGAAIWGSSPFIDVFRGLVYIATGNLYNAPPEVLKCEEAQNNQTSPPSGPNQCIGPDVYFDSIMAFCINFGQILWSTRLSGSDNYSYACLVSPNNPIVLLDLIMMQILERHQCFLATNAS